MNKILLKNAMVVSPGDNLKEELDILIKDDKIKKIAKGISNTEAEKVIDLTGKIITPGFIDLHVHLREPGFTHKEDLITGTKAAARGGFTTVVAMPNTNPIIDKAPLVNSTLTKAKEKAVVNVEQIGAITQKSQGQKLAEIGLMKEAGIVAISDDGRSVMDSEVMRLGLKYAKNFDLPVMVHCEDENLAADGVVDEGYYSTITGLGAIPATAENVIVARDIYLAEETGAKLHIAHISTKGAVDLVRQAKARGVDVTCEVTPHHFSLTAAAITDYDTATKVNPPLRSEADVEAIKAGLKDGTIDAIATDHAPHAREEKEQEYDLAPFGISGLETAFALVNQELIQTGILSLEEAIAKLTLEPAKILGKQEKMLEPGSKADLAVADLEQEWRVEPEEFYSKGKNTPFKGKKLTGDIAMTIVAGEIVYTRG